MTIRRATVTGGDERRVARYLPSNYQVTGVNHATGLVYIKGEDVAGWTMGDYVIPRLATGLMTVKEF